jgi:positive regulator of sigma E activity
MIEERARVEKLSDKEMELRIIVPGECDKCGVKDNCYGNNRVISVPKRPGLVIGDEVDLSIRNISVLKMTGLIYGIPLIGLIVGLFSGYFLFFRSFTEDPRILLSVSVCVVCFFLAGSLVSRLEKRAGKRLEYCIEKRRT